MTPARLRMSHDVVKLRRLGDRPMLELLAEIGERNGCLEDVAARLQRYAGMSSQTLRSVDGDRLEQCRPRLVG